MAKSRGRKLAELVAPTNGVFAAASIPTIALSKLASSTFSVNSESASLGGNVVLDSNDVTEHTNALYFTNARADARITAASLLPLAGGTMTGNLTLGDNVNAYFGASTDLRIYHDGTNSHIINSTGELRFTGSNFAIKSDSAKLLLGASDDLQIYHDGSNSYIKDYGAGRLHILSATDFLIANTGNTQNYIYAVESGAVKLYYSGSTKFETNSGGVTVTGTAILGGATFVDNATAYFGTGLDLRIYHDGSNSYIKNNTGWLNMPIGGNGVSIANSDFSESLAKFIVNGACELYHNGSKKIETTSTGITVTGNVTADGASITGQVLLGGITNTAGGYLLKIGGSGNDGELNLSANSTSADIASYDRSTSAYKLLNIHALNTNFVTGSVGIGTGANPEYRLQINGSNVSSGGGLATVGIFDEGTAYNGTKPGGGIAFRGKYNSSGSITNFGSIQAFKENATNNDYGSAMVFTTRTDGSNLTERMRIASSGNVGIGDAPSSFTNAALHVAKDMGNSVTAVARLRGRNTTARTTRLQFEDYAGAIADGLIDFHFPNAGSHTNAYFGMGYNTSTHLAINVNGQVGAGTTTPTQARLVAHTASGMSIAATKDNTGASISLGGVTQPRVLIEAEPSASGLKIYTATGSSYSSANWVVRAHFNSSGHLVLGSSSHADDLLYLVRSNAGKLQRFYVGSDEQGWIGAANGDLNINGGPSEHAGLRFQATSIMPRHNNADSNGAVDLGLTSNKWKDIYASNYVYASGIWWQNDTDTGMYRNDTDSISFRVGGNDYFTIDGDVSTYTHMFNSNTYSWYVGTSGNTFNFYDGGGTQRGYVHPGNGFVNGSDRAYKENISDITYGLETVKKLQPRKFKFKDTVDMADDSVTYVGEESVGFIAQELEQEIPELVMGEDGTKTVAYSQLTAVLTKAIQEQQALIEALQTEVAALKG